MIQSCENVVTDQLSDFTGIQDLLSLSPHKFKLQHQNFVDAVFYTLVIYRMVQYSLCNKFFFSFNMFFFLIKKHLLSSSF